MTDLVADAIDRLKGTSPLKHVAGLLSLNALTMPPIDKMPAAFVLTKGATYGQANGLLNAVRQAGTQSFRVVLFIASKAPQGEDVFDPVAPVQSAVMARLLGWQPDPNFGAVQIAAEQLLDVQATFFAYEMTFFRSHTVRA